MQVEREGAFVSEPQVPLGVFESQSEKKISELFGKGKGQMSLRSVKCRL